MPDDIPIPQPRPDTIATPAVKPDPEVSTPDRQRSSDDVGGEQEKPLPVEAEAPERLNACLAELKALGAQFREIPRKDDGSGCGIDRPIELRSLGGQIALKPAGEMRCETALRLSRWTAAVLVPMLKAARPEETLSSLEQASTYVCRRRNGASTGKISEHARGNAIDIAGLGFKSGNRFAIRPRMKDSTMDGALQRAITSAACLYFTTVLDPGSDAAHETHLHLDVIERRNGYRYCW